jgi:hypothetical protein
VVSHLKVLLKLKESAKVLKASELQNIGSLCIGYYVIAALL